MNRRMMSIMMGLCMILSITSTMAATPKGDNVIIKASNSEVNYTGRVDKLADGAVRYDWVGTYLQTDFTGGTVAIDVSESGNSYHNVFIDGHFKQKIKIVGKEKHHITLATGLTKNVHRLMLQKCTEGEYGCTTIYDIILSKGSKLTRVAPKTRFIEIYGDSYTCGYGSESPKATDPFKLETENCNKAYGCIIARYFDADYSLVAHSGRGVVRNYGDSVQLSKNTISSRQTHVYDDFDKDKIYDFKAYKPDLVMINLGTNDFSVQPVPSDEQYVGGYVKMIQQIRHSYGNVPILCIIAHSANTNLLRCLSKLKQEMKGDKDVYLSNPMANIVTEAHDMGASYHPNYIGHKKIAMTLIPLISAIKNWPLENKIVE